MIKNRFLGIMLSLAVICPSFISGMNNEMNLNKKKNGINLKSLIIKATAMSVVGFTLCLGGHYVADEHRPKTGPLKFILDGAKPWAFPIAFFVGGVSGIGTAVYSLKDEIKAWFGWGKKKVKDMKETAEGLKENFKEKKEQAKKIGAVFKDPTGFIKEKADEKVCDAGRGLAGYFYNALRWLKGKRTETRNFKTIEEEEEQEKMKKVELEKKRFLNSGTKVDRQNSFLGVNGAKTKDLMTASVMGDNGIGNDFGKIGDDEHRDQVINELGKDNLGGDGVLIASNF